MKNPKSGFALLFVLATAAALAIMLYMAMPRVAFEAQRDKEQLLIDRGQQYSRAINLFVRKFNRYPADFDALNNTQNLRFLRKQYVDPFTGKQEWRLIHVGPGGVFLDSLVYNKKKTDAAPTEQQTFITEMQQVGGNPVDPSTGGQFANQANRDAVRNGLSGQEVNLVPSQPQQLGDPAAAPPPPSPPPPQFDINGQPIPQPGVPAVPVNNTVNNTFPPQIGPDGQPVLGQPGIPGSPQSPVTLPPGVQLPPGTQLPPGVQPFGAQPGIPGQQQVQQQQNAPNSAAANMINQLLTTPRPGGLPNLGGPQTATTAAVAGGLNPVGATPTAFGATAQQPTAQTVGGGVAGIASKVEQEGIKLYNDKKKYNEWEFVYDLTKDPTRTGIPGGAPQQPPANANGAAAPGAAAGATGATGATAPTTATPTPTSPPAALPTQ